MIKRRSESLYMHIQCEANLPRMANLAGYDMDVVRGGRTNSRHILWSRLEFYPRKARKGLQKENLCRLKWFSF